MNKYSSSWFIGLAELTTLTLRAWKLTANQKKHCNKYYPQPFRTTASVNEKTGRAEYKRTDNGDNPTIRQRVDGVFKDVQIGNQWIVPYNPYLLLKYNCHICVVVTAASCVKCLFKYVTKGADMAKARVSGVSSEIEQYRKPRYISAAEAYWRILGFDIINRTPAVTLVHAHLEGNNNVVFREAITSNEREQLAETAVSDLMRYLERPSDEKFSSLTILDYFEPYVIQEKRRTTLSLLLHHQEYGWMHTGILFLEDSPPKSAASNSKVPQLVIFFTYASSFINLPLDLSSNYVPSPPLNRYLLNTPLSMTPQEHRASSRATRNILYVWKKRLLSK